MSDEPEEEKSGQEQGSRRARGRARRHRHGLIHGHALVHRHALLALWLGALGLMAMGAAVWLAYYLESPAMHERVRQMAVARLEAASGGRVELQSVGWKLRRLEFELDGLRIHGTEAAAEAPLLAVERVTARLKWSELLAGHVTLRRLQVVQPLAHILVNKDGSTNIPGVRARAAEPKNQPLLRLKVDEAELVDGRLDWNAQKFRLDGVASGLFVQLVHSPAEHRVVDPYEDRSVNRNDARYEDRYEGKLRVGQVRMRMPQAEPLALSGDAEFRLLRNRVEVPRLRVNQRGWVVEASGVVNDLASPVVQLSYRAAGDVAELARLVHYRELTRGALQLSGQGSYRWSSGEYAATGKAQASQVSWGDPILRLERISGGFTYSLDGHAGGAGAKGWAATGSLAAPEHFNLPSIFATALGGTVRAKMEVTQEPGRESVGQITGDVTGVDLEKTLAAFASRELPLERLALAGETTGTLDVNWRGSLQNARMDGDLLVHPVARAGRFPVTAVVQATVAFANSSVEVHKLEAHTEGTYLSAEGRLSADSDLQVDLRTDKFSELTPLVSSWRGSRAQELPVEFGGPAAFQGSVLGKVASPALAGHLELHGFTTVLRIPAKLVSGGEAPAASRVLRNRWDMLTGEVRYSSTGESLRNGLLQHGEMRIHVDASLGLTNGSYNAKLPFAAQVKVENVEAAQLQRLLGVSYPIAGRVSGEVQVNGTSEYYSGNGHVVLRDGTAWRQTLRSAAAELELAKGHAGSEARLRNIVVKSDAMQLTGDAHFNLDTREFGFAARGSDVKLEKLRALTERKIALTGTAAFDARGEGTPAAPVINGRLSLSHLVYNGQAIGGVEVDAATRGSLMKLTARSNFPDADVKLDGEVELRGEMPMHLRGDLQSAKLNELLGEYLPLRLEQPSEVRMHLEARGEAKHPREMTAELDVERLAAGYGGIAMSNDGTIRLKMEHQVVSVEQFRMTAEGGSRFVRVRGEVQLAGAREIDLRVDGSVNLKLLETANPNLMAGGAANLNLQVNGTLDRPSMRGLLKVQDASIAYIDFPNGLSDINGSLVFSEDRLQLQELTARTGGGLLHCSGFLSYAPGQGLGFNLSANGSGIRLRYPEGLSSTADARLTLSGTLKNALLSGEVTVTHMGVNPRFDFAAYLAKGIRGAPVQRLDSPLNALHLDVRVLSTSELEVQTTLARMSGDIDLRLRGSAFRPVLLGRVNLLEGQLEFNSTKYRLERGDVTFTNPVRIEPTLDMELSARVRDYDITLGLHGPVDKLVTTYRSDPPLSSSDIISLLALGRTTEEQANPALMGSSQYAPAVSESASSAVLGQALNATVGSRVQRLFGVSRVKIDPNVGGALNAGLARVTVEQQVSNNLTLTYISNLNQSAQQIIQFEYNVNKTVSVVGVRDQNGVVSFDVLFRKRKK